MVRYATVQLSLVCDVMSVVFYRNDIFIVNLVCLSSLSQLIKLFMSNDRIWDNFIWIAKDV